ncbi:MAG: T9SS type A sorting domain-containing protein [Sediminibacterium sp.]|nr:T9SS type A sorting domain-containing protein [Sediminibacterium sp.]
MKRVFIALGCLTTIALARGQTVTPTVYASNGGSSTQSGGMIQWTIGEPVSETYFQTNNVTTMGFHQPELGILSMIQEQGANVNVLVYPNPVITELRLDLSGLPDGKYNLELHDAIGKLISVSQKEVSSYDTKHVLNMQEIAAGEYFLSVRGSSFNKTVKIVKTH